jgi:hypothetical protein
MSPLWASPGASTRAAQNWSPNPSPNLNRRTRAFPTRARSWLSQMRTRTCRPPRSCSHHGPREYLPWFRLVWALHLVSPRAGGTGVGTCVYGAETFSSRNAGQRVGSGLLVCLEPWHAVLLARVHRSLRGLANVTLHLLMPIRHPDESVRKSYALFFKHTPRYYSAHFSAANVGSRSATLEDTRAVAGSHANVTRSPRARCLAGDRPRGAAHG